MRIAILGALSAVAVLSACTPDLILANAKPANLSQQEIVEIQASMKHDMFDPESAQFRNMRGYTATFQDGHVENRACFEVNGKNRLGGYVGFQEHGAKKTNGTWEITSGCHNI